ncbi:MAG: TonB-dependent receptor plug domain-containing protein, partial [bacterium]
MRVLKHIIAAMILLANADVVAAQTAQLSEVINQEADAGGIDQEVDAAPAQVDAIEAGDEVNLSPRERAGIEEIVVSARKRDELLEETPVSITALDANTLSEAGITDLRNIRNLVPNMQFEAIAISATTSSNIRIRGVGTPGAGTSFDPGVGVYVDGIYMSRSLSSILDLADIAQVEVLRGPQGTLFGKNTVGGAMNLTTTKPSADLEAFASVRVANFGVVDTRASINAPITDWLATRLTFVSRNSKGWFTNTYRETDLSDRNVVAFMGSVQILPTNDITIDITGSWSSFHNNGKGGQCLPVVREGLGGLVPGFYDACAEDEPFRFAADTDNVVDVKSFGTWGTLTWDAGDLGPLSDLSVKSITSWRKQI